MKLIAITTVSLLMVMMGCANDEQVTHESRALKKSQLRGEFFTSATLVKKHSHSAFGFTGMQCPLERVVFAITEDKLLAYRSYNKGVSNDLSRQTLVAAFSIANHFDLDAGGNIITNRPWREREFIAVDWSENLAPHLDCNGWLQSVTSLSLRNNGLLDGREPFRVRIEKDYLETTVDAIVAPDQDTCDSLDEWSCQPAEYRVKFSFRKVDGNNDYEKRHYPDVETIRYGTHDGKICLAGDKDCQGSLDLWLYENAQQREICDPLKHNVDDCYAPSVKLNAQFGFFRTDASIYDRKSGFSPQGRQLLINRWNLWQKSVDENNHPIPLGKRLPKKIVYYVNPGFPKSLMPSIKRIESEWNTAFAHVVAQARSQCHIDEAIDFAQKNNLSHVLNNAGITEVGTSNLATVCRTLHEVTKKRRVNERFYSGDVKEIDEAFGKIFEIRNNDCNEYAIKRYVAKHGLAGVLSAHGLDSLTDDNIEQACAVLEWEGTRRGIPEKFTWQQHGDLRYSFINAVARPDGESLLGYGPSGVDPKTGEIITGSVNVYLSAITQQATYGALLLEQVSDRSKDLKETSPKNFSAIDELSAYVDKAINSMTAATYRAPKTVAFQTRNFATAADLGTFKSFAGLAAADFSTALMSINDSMSDLMAIIIGKNQQSKVDLTKFARQKKRDEFYAERSACFSRAYEIPYTSLNARLRAMTKEERILYIRDRIFEAVVKHELGHTFGLRHNFKGTYDALNYPPNFWGVDTNDFRMRNGLAEEELRSSSVMDYHKRFNSDFSGLGLYDYAALLSGYAGIVEVFDTTDDNFVPRSFINNLDMMTYKDLPYLFSGGMAEQKIVRHMQIVKDDYLRGNASAHMQIATLGLPKRPDNFYKRRFVNYEELKRQTLLEAFGDDPSIFPVPYAYCTDGQAGQLDISCHPFIYGSSPSEIVESSIRDYELLRSLNNTDGLLPKSVPSYLNYLYGRIYAPILRTYQAMYMASNNASKIFPAVYDLTVGSKRGLNFISQVLQAVEPGEYCKDHEGNYVPKVDNGSCDAPITIHDDAGKVYHSKFGDELVGNQKEVGYVYDKILALLMLIDDNATLLHEFSRWQSGNYSVGFYRVFTPQIVNLFSHLFMNQWQGIAPTISLDDHQKPIISYRDLFSSNPDVASSRQPKIRPGFSPALREYAIIFSMAGLSNPLDHKLDFAKRAQIKRIGAHVSMTDDDEHITFVDPNSGIGYRATIREDKSLSPGFLLLKDARDFVSDTTQPENVAGRWFTAKSAYKEAKAKLVQARTLRLHTTHDAMAALEQDERRAYREFRDANQLLNDKVRVIEQVRALSNVFAD